MTVDIIHLPSTDSTNNYLRSFVEQKADLLVVTTDFQTAGRGQGSNSWESEPGANLLMSARLGRVSVPVKEQFILSMAGALAVGDALSEYVDEGISLKWPNDVYWNDGKISGTLIETAVRQGSLAHCIFGIGVNVNQVVFRSNAPNPVSLRQITGVSYDVREVSEKVVSCLVSRLEQVADRHFQDIISLYHAHLYRRTGFFPYRDANGLFMARIERVEPDGHLILHDVEGKRRSYAFKEVAFVLSK